MVESVQERADHKAAKKAYEQPHCSSEHCVFGRSVLTHLQIPIPTCGLSWIPS